MSVKSSPDPPRGWLRAVCTQKMDVSEGLLSSLPYQWPSIPHYPDLGARTKEQGVLSQGHPRVHFLMSSKNVHPLQGVPFPFPQKRCPSLWPRGANLPEKAHRGSSLGQLFVFLAMACLGNGWEQSEAFRPPGAQTRDRHTWENGEGSEECLRATEGGLGKLRDRRDLWGRFEEKAGFGPEMGLVGIWDRRNAEAKMLRSEWTQWT